MPRHVLQILVLAILLPACRGGGTPGGGGPVFLAAMNGFPVLAQIARPSLAITPLTGPGFRDYTQLHGLVYDALNDALYTVEWSTGLLLRLNPTTGSVTPIGLTGSSNVSSLAFDSSTRTMYATAMGRHLLRIDLATGEGSLVGAMNGPGLGSMAFDAGTSTLYGIEDPFAGVYSINTSTAAATLLFNGIPSQCLAFNTNNGLLYGISTQTNQIATMNPANSQVTFQGFAAHPMDGLAYLPASDRLLGVYLNALYEVDKTTGATTRIAQIGLQPPSDIAYDPLLNCFYGTSGNMTLYRIDPATAVRTVIGPTGLPQNSTILVGLAFDPGPRTLFATDTANLLTLNIATGAATIIGPIGGIFVMDLALDPGSGTLWAARANGELVTLNRATGAGTTVGGFGAGSPQTIGFIPSSGKLYASNFGSTASLFTVNTATGAATPVGPLYSMWADGLDAAGTSLYAVTGGTLFLTDPATALYQPVNALGLGISGMAWDPNGRILYGVDSSFLMKINPTTGAITYVGLTDVRAPNLAYDRHQNILYGVNVPRTLLKIDVGTGAPTTVGATGILPSGLAYQPVERRLYAIDLSGIDRLFRIDSATGAATLVGTNTGFWELSGLVYDSITGDLLSYDAASGNLVRINTTTGAGSVLGRPRQGLSSFTILD